MASFISPPSPAPVDSLFLERLEAFLDKSTSEIKAFSEREGRDLDETRRYVAEWHCRHLFKPGLDRGAGPSQKANGDDNRTQAYAILHDTSQALETLHSISGIHSFILAVDPAPDGRNLLAGPGFLGGTQLGREFWRSSRGGGNMGAKAFKAYCARSQPSTSPYVSEDETRNPKATVKARILKAELYDSMRTALRLATGNRTAEMKWSNHARLASYGVRLVGWPDKIPHKNPSALSIAEMRILLEALRHGSLRFVGVDQSTSSSTETVRTSLPEGLVVEDALNWVREDALDENGNEAGPGMSMPR